MDCKYNNILSSTVTHISTKKNIFHSEKFSKMTQFLECKLVVRNKCTSSDNLRSRYTYREHFNYDLKLPGKVNYDANLLASIL